MADEKDIAEQSEFVGAHVDIAKLLKEITQEQKEQLSNAKKMGIEGQLLEEVKSRQLNSEKQMSLIQISLVNKLKLISQLEKERAAIIDKTSDGYRIATERIASINKQIGDSVNYYKNLNKEILHSHGLVTLLNKAGLGRLVDVTKELVLLWKTHPLFAIGTIVLAALIKIFAIFKEIDAAAATFRMSMGITRDVTDDIDKNARSISISLSQVGVTAEHVYKAFLETAKLLGSVQFATADMARDVSLMAAQLGIAESTSVDFLKTMGMMGKTTADAQNSMLLFTAKLSEAAGTPLVDVMNDVVAATKTSYSFMSKSPLALAKAAVEAKKMGTSLSSAAQSAKSLIDFTSSVTSEMEASVLLGQSINVQRARELAYRKDLRGLNQEILKIAQQTHFEDLDPFQQEAVARALGKSADEVGQILQSERQRQKVLSDPSLSRQRMEYERIKRANDDIVKQTADSARKQLSIESNQERIRSITLAWRGIMQRIAEMFLPAIDFTLNKIAKSLNFINDKFGGWLKYLAPILGIMALMTGGKILGRLMGMFSGAVGKAAQSFFTGLSSGISKMGSPGVLKGILAIALLGIAMIPFAFAIKKMTGLDWKSLGIAIVALIAFTAAAFALGALIAGPGAILFGAGLIGFVALGAALFVFGGAAMFAGKGMKGLGEGLKVTVDGFAALSNLNFFNTIRSVWSLVAAVTELSKALKALPDVNIDKLKMLADMPSLNMNVAQQPKPESNEDVVVAINDGFNKLISGIRNGDLAANVFIDSQRLSSAVDRRIKFTGEL